MKSYIEIVLKIAKEEVYIIVDPLKEEVFVDVNLLPSDIVITALYAKTPLVSVEAGPQNLFKSFVNIDFCIDRADDIPSLKTWLLRQKEVLNNDMPLFKGLVEDLD